MNELIQNFALEMVRGRWTLSVQTSLYMFRIHNVYIQRLSAFFVSSKVEKLQTECVTLFAV